MLSWFIYGIKGNLEFKYTWEQEKKIPILSQVSFHIQVSFFRYE